MAKKDPHLAQLRGAESNLDRESTYWSAPLNCDVLLSFVASINMALLTELI
jgi:hypothetical protein